MDSIYNKKKMTMRQILAEGKSAEQLADAFVKRNPNLDKGGLIELLMADPTAVRNNRGSFTGRYGVWIGNMYANGSIKLGDIPELKTALVTYDKNKTQLPPIKDCKSLSELIGWVKDLSDDFKPVRNQSKAKADLEKVYEDDEWVVYVPHSHAAARRGGEGTHWCTASENDYYYNMYSNQGPLYINIRKSDGAKFQFHFETNQFMDADDEPESFNAIGLSEGIIEFYTKTNPRFKPLMEYDYVGNFENGLAFVKLNGKWNFINTDGQFVSKQWFDYIKDFNNGVAVVELNGKYNFINKEGRILSDQWFDIAEDFIGDLARVELNRKENFIKTNGQLLSKQWFDLTYGFSEGFASVELNGKWNFINTEGQLLSKRGFDYAYSFNDGFAKVKLNGKWNFINTEGQILSKRGFDTVNNFFYGFARVMLNQKYNFIDTKGQLLSKQWFDNAGFFDGKFARVLLNGRWGKIDTEGNLTLEESSHTASPVITESVLHLTIAECVKRILSQK